MNIVNNLSYVICIFIKFVLIDFNKDFKLEFSIEVLNVFVYIRYLNYEWYNGNYFFLCFVKRENFFFFFKKFNLILNVDGFIGVVFVDLFNNCGCFIG